MTIASILRHKGGEVIAVAPEDDAASVARTLSEHGIGAVLVRERGGSGAVLGIVSERDIVRAMAVQGTGTTRLPAERLMTRDLVTVTPRTRVTEAMGLMTDRRIRHLPVLDDAGALVGMVSIGDLVKARMMEIEREAESLREFVTAA